MHGIMKIVIPAALMGPAQITTLVHLGHLSIADMYDQVAAQVTLGDQYIVH